MVFTPQNSIFPSKGLQVLSALIHFLGVSILAHCASRRLAVEDFTSWNGFCGTTWPRLCIILVFIDSWLFVFSSGVLIFGVGLEMSPTVCGSAIYICIAFYATSKILIYAFLIEKVHVVWSPATGSSRFKSRVYLFCFITLVAYALTVASVMIAGNIHELRSDGVCVIGLKRFSTIPMLTFDFSINFFLTMFFLWPLFNTSVLNPKVRRVATRTLIAATVALTTSMVNILILTILHGKQLGWVCLGSCGSDVLINAAALFWVTGAASGNTNSSGAVIGLPDRERVRPSMVGRDIKAGAPIFLSASPAGIKDGASVGDLRKEPVREYIPHRTRDQRSSFAHQVEIPDRGISSMFSKLFGKNKSEDMQVQVTITTEMETFTRDEMVPQRHRELNGPEEAEEHSV